MPAHQFVAILSRFSVIPVVFTLIFAANCSKSDPDIVGFHIYEFGKTTKKDGGACSKKDNQSFCSNNASPNIANHKTQTNLYFNGHEPDSPLAEIQVVIWNCRPGDLSTELYNQLGKPDQFQDSRSRWNLKHMVVIGLLGRKDDLCTLHFLEPSENDRMLELFPPS